MIKKLYFTKLNNLDCHHIAYSCDVYITIAWILKLESNISLIVFHIVPLIVINFFFFFFFCLFAISWAAPAAHGDSQARGRIRAVAAGLHHSSQQHRILNLLSKARNQTHVLTDTSQIRYRWATRGTPLLPLIYPLLLKYTLWKISSIEIWSESTSFKP